MIEKEKLKQAIYGAIDEVNRQLSSEQRLEKSMNTILLGSSGKLDSLGLVNLIVAAEQKVEEGFSVTISLTDDEAIFQEDGPLKTVGTFFEHIYSIVGNNSNG